VWVLFGLLLLPAVASSQGPLMASARGDEDLAELLAILADETEIATKTRMNSDYVPGIVTVLEGDELEALGIETVWEALRMVPGVEPVRDAVGNPSVVVRGIDFPFNSGNVRVLIDSIPLNRESSGINGAVLDMPIEQVERVEVIRGPGSVVYGEFAFMGIVNVVTRKQGNRLHVRGDSEEHWSGSARLGARPDAALQWSLAAAGWTSDQADVPEGKAADENRGFGSGSVAYGGLSASAQYVRRNADGRAPEAAPPPETTAPVLSFEQESWAIETRYERDLGKDLRGKVRLGRLHDRLAGFPSEFESHLTRAGADLHWTGWARHSFLLSAELSSLGIERGYHAPASRNADGQPRPPLEIADISRHVVAVTLQDRIDLAEPLSATAGVRWDHYDDIGNRITPRLALVWRASEHHILKAQYAEGFRPPTFFEQYGGGERNPALDFEVNRTLELNYVYRQPGTVGRATLFRTDIDDMIYTIPGSFLWGNTREARSSGVELEWTQQLPAGIKGVASFSWAHTEDSRGNALTPTEGVAAPDWMGNLALLARPFAHTVLAARYTHVGARPTEAAGSYDLIDLTLTQAKLGLPGLELRAGIKNALDDEVAYVLSIGPQPVVSFRGRTLWAQVSWSK